MTHENWLDMWEKIKDIEDAYEAIPPHRGYRRRVKLAIVSIKKYIQDEVGQLQ
jgi:hypothetical protein